MNPYNLFYYCIYLQSYTCFINVIIILLYFLCLQLMWTLNFLGTASKIRIFTVFSSLIYRWRITYKQQLCLWNIYVKNLTSVESILTERNKTICRVFWTKTIDMPLSTLTLLECVSIKENSMSTQAILPTFKMEN